VPGIPAAAAARLEAAGIHRPEELVAAAERRDARLESIAPDAAERARWLAAARLMGVRGLGLRGAGWLAAAGVHTVEELAASDPAELERRMLADPSGLPPEPYPAEIRVWVRGARAARR
jgi:predicted flap endonuclease-1-like 5' DNA nuclease